MLRGIAEWRRSGWAAAGVDGAGLRGTWIRFWMRRAGRDRRGRLATRLATWLAPPYKARAFLAGLNPAGYVSPTAIIHHPDLRLGRNVFIGDQVVIYQAGEGTVDLGDRVRLHRDVIIEVGRGGSLSIGADTHVQPRCQFAAYEAPIRIGCGVQIAPYCAFYPYNHGFRSGQLISQQPLQSKGGIVVENDAWLGVGATILDGVRVGKGAVVAAGAVVSEDVPDEAIVAGVPARIVKMRCDLAPVATRQTGPDEGITA